VIAEPKFAGARLRKDRKLCAERKAIRRRIVGKAYSRAEPRGAAFYTALFFYEWPAVPGLADPMYVRSA
jgi:hypothetical protein